MRHGISRLVAQPACQLRCQPFIVSDQELFTRYLSFVATMQNPQLPYSIAESTSFLLSLLDHCHSPVRNVQLRQPTHVLTTGKQFATGLTSAILNPKNALFYMSLMTVILGNKVTLWQQGFCGAWMFFAVLSWDLLIATLISHPKLQRILNHQIHLIERGAGVVLVCFGLALLWRRLS